MKSPRIGLLPFYLKLYDDLLPERPTEFDAFVARIAAGFEARGVSVLTAPVCRVAPEFAAAVAGGGAAGGGGGGPGGRPGWPERGGGEGVRQSSRRRSRASSGRALTRS